MGTTATFTLLERSYVLYTPAGIGTNAPLVISCHPGLSGPTHWSTSSSALNSTLNAKADAGGFYVAYPAGNDRNPALALLTWNAGWCCGYSYQANCKDMLFIRNLVKKLLQLYSIAPNHVFLNGYSNGAMLSLAMLSKYPSLFAGAVLAAGALVIDHGDAAASIPVPVTLINGTSDTTVPPGGGIGDGYSGAYFPPLADTIAFLRGKGATVTSIMPVGAQHTFSTIVSALAAQYSTDFASIMANMVAAKVAANAFRPWDLTNASYQNKNFSVTSQETTPTGFTFSADGTKLYIIGSVNKFVYQYTLTTPWDVSTGSYASKSMNASAEDTSPQDIFFSADGTKLYTVGATTHTVYQYTLTTAWDVSTGSYASKSLVVNDSPESGLFFSSDGTKIYVSSTTGVVLQFTLTTPWDVSTGSYSGKNKNVSGDANNIQGVAFSADGMRMFTIGNSFAARPTVYQYALSTAWNIGTAVYTGISKDVGSEIASGFGFGVGFRQDDGSKMYALSSNTATVFQYGL